VASGNKKQPKRRWHPKSWKKGKNQSTRSNKSSESSLAPDECCHSGCGGCLETIQKRKQSTKVPDEVASLRMWWWRPETKKENNQPKRHWHPKSWKKGENQSTGSNKSSKSGLAPDDAVGPETIQKMKTIYRSGVGIRSGGKMEKRKKSTRKHHSRWGGGIQKTTEVALASVARKSGIRSRGKKGKNKSAKKQ